jgi:hypothetical protein
MRVYTIIFRVIDGDVYEIPVQTRGSWWTAARRAIEFVGLRRRDVIFCLGENYNG